MVSFVSVPNGAELAFVQGSRTRTSLHADVPHVLAKVRPGKGDRMLIFSIPGLAVFS